MMRICAIVIWLSVMLAGLMVQLFARSNPVALRAMPANTRLSESDLDGLHVNDRVGRYLRNGIVKGDPVSTSNSVPVPQLAADGRAIFAATIANGSSVAPKDTGLLCTGKVELSKAEIVALLCPVDDTCIVLTRLPTGTAPAAPFAAAEPISFQKTCK